MENMLGVMIDCSRNAVMKVDSVKRFAKIIRDMGYNTLMLYTEDTYEVENQPAFGYLRGRYTVAELQELDSYCVSIGIELVPCIQTLAHLNCIFKWREYYEDINDIDDVLMVGEEKTYRLIEDMFSTLRKCYTTQNIHIGMDEAYSVGLGKYLQKHGFRERFDVINEHLHKVCEIAEKYGFRPMIWSDMFCKLALNTDDYYSVDAKGVNNDRYRLPESVSMVYWDYYSMDYDRYKKMIALNQSFGRPVVFAGGLWTWRGFAPGNQFGIDVSRPAIAACRDSGVTNVFFTLWGDDGGECSRFGVLPALMFAAEAYRGNTDEASIKEKFRQLVGCDWDTFMVLDQLDCPSGWNQAPSKYLLYNDPFLGFLDSQVKDHDNGYYQALTEKLEDLPLPEEYIPIRNYCAALSKVMSYKSQLGCLTRKAYEADDKTELRRLANEDYVATMDKIRVFHGLYREFWMQENKPQGFEMHDIRLGGLILRLETCRGRLLDYCDGKIPNLPELEEKLLCTKPLNSWATTATPGAVSRFFY